MGTSVADARAVIAQARRILVATGAGMSADSGLPTYRGPDGIWTTFDGGDPVTVMTGDAYRTRPAELWARHRVAQQQRVEVQPHVGYDVLAAWAARRDVFVTTSNVDGLHQRSGIAEDRLHEVHGSSWWMQCLERCGVPPWPRPSELPSLPLCPGCGSVARLNIVLFSDRDFDPVRRSASARRLQGWLAEPVDVVLEVGAGSVLRTIRRCAERAAREHGCPLVRINLDEPEVPSDEPSWFGLQGRAADVLAELA